ncbi:MAG: class I SAM-dependent methyltransferase [Betaproteobacteria bacterium]|nr:class I SAM-dependent methyltransferase [Betaproteobacteria bacterium]
MTDSGKAQVPRRLNLGSGKAYKPEYLNVDINPMWRPDVCVDLSSPGVLERELEAERFGRFRLSADWFDEIVATDVLEHVPDLVTLMTHCLILLRDGGVLRALVPFDLSYGAWQDPTHVRAFNERSWLYYTDWHWYMGWREARFDLAEMGFVLSDIGQKLHAEKVEMDVICRTPRAVDSMKVALAKRSLTNAERAAAEQWLQRR